MAFSFEREVFDLVDSIRGGSRFIIQQNTYGNGGRMPWAIVDSESGSPIKRDPFYDSLKQAAIRARELNQQWETIKAERALCQTKSSILSM